MISQPLNLHIQNFVACFWACQMIMPNNSEHSRIAPFGLPENGVKHWLDKTTLVPAPPVTLLANKGLTISDLQDT